MREEKKEFRRNILFGGGALILVVVVVSLLFFLYWSFRFSETFSSMMLGSSSFVQIQETGSDWLVHVSPEGFISATAADTGVHTPLTPGEGLAVLPSDESRIMGMFTIQMKDGKMVNSAFLNDVIMDKVFPGVFGSFLVCAAVILSVFALYFCLISRKPYQDLQQMRRMVRQIAQGGETVRLTPVTRDSSMASLARDLDTMQERIEREAETRQTMLQYISHEMKTPIMIVESYAASAREGIYPKGTLDDTLDTIQTQTQRMKQKVEDLLTMVHLEFAKTMTSKDRFRVREGILDTLQLLGGTLRGRKVDVRVSQDTCLYGNTEMLRILLENLITNQMKYAETYISIREYREGEQLVLDFCNDGKPVSPELAAVLFQPFEKRYKGNNGLGLSICRMIMDRLGGSICLLSEGTEIRFHLVFPESTVCRREELPEE